MSEENKKTISVTEADRMMIFAALEYSRGLLHGKEVDNPYEEHLTNLSTTVMNGIDIKWECNER